jgi:hypothetical protein
MVLCEPHSCLHCWECPACSADTYYYCHVYFLSICTTTLGMERVITLRELRDTGSLPGDFAAQHPQVLTLHVNAASAAGPLSCTAGTTVLEAVALQAAQLVSWLMAADAADRPTARQVREPSDINPIYMHHHIHQHL